MMAFEHVVPPSATAKVGSAPSRFCDRTCSSNGLLGHASSAFARAFASNGRDGFSTSSRSFENQPSPIRVKCLEAQIAYRQLLLEEIIHRTENTLQMAIAIIDDHIGATSDYYTRNAPLK
jgi:hypothetical protein